MKMPDLKPWLIQGLRRISYRWPGRYRVKLAARVSRNKYKCAKCPASKTYAPREIVLDHIDPVVDPKVGFVDWNTYIARLFVGEDGWQVLCKKCHNKKTKKENERRKKC